MKATSIKLWGMISLVALIMLLGALFVNKATEDASAKQVLGSRQCVILDAGHGGEDGGAISCTGRKESDLNLELSLRLRDLLNFMGIRVHMIRTTDISVYTQGTTLAQKKISDLKERVRIMNTTPNAIIISIHQNTYPQESCHGPQVFYGNAQSKTPAIALQKLLNDHVCPDSDRKAKQAKGIYLMEHVESVTLLTECGFLSNPEEEAKLYSKEYQLRICGALASFCAEFMKEAKIA